MHVSKSYIKRIQRLSEIGRRIYSTSTSGRAMDTYDLNFDPVLWRSKDLATSESEFHDRGFVLVDKLINQDYAAEVRHLAKFAIIEFLLPGGSQQKTTIAFLLVATSLLLLPAIKATTQCTKLLLLVSNGSYFSDLLVLLLTYLLLTQGLFI